MKDFSKLQTSSFSLNNIQDNASNMSSLADSKKEYPLLTAHHSLWSKVLPIKQTESQQCCQTNSIHHHNAKYRVNTQMYGMHLFIVLQNVFPSSPLCLLNCTLSSFGSICLSNQSYGVQQIWFSHTTTSSRRGIYLVCQSAFPIHFAHDDGFKDGHIT